MRDRRFKNKSYSYLYEISKTKNNRVITSSFSFSGKKEKYHCFQSHRLNQNNWPRVSNLNYNINCKGSADFVVCHATNHRSHNNCLCRSTIISDSVSYLISSFSIQLIIYYRGKVPYQTGARGLIFWLYI